MHRLPIRFLCIWATLTASGCFNFESEPKYKPVSLIELSANGFGLWAGNLCGITTENNLVCWTAGDHIKTQEEVTRIFEPNSRVFSLTGNDVYACFIKAENDSDTNGSPFCWGYNIADIPTKHSVPEPIVTLSTGRSHTCGLSVSGRAFCAGFNGYGQLGTGVTSPDQTELDEGQVRVPWVPQQVTVVTEKLSSIAAGAGFTCVLNEDGRLSCWGNNHVGQLTTMDGQDSALPVTAEASIEFKSISAHGGYACGITKNRDVACWGREISKINSSDPNPVRILPGLKDVTQLALGTDFACALNLDKQVYCWGNNSDGQIGPSSLGATISKPIVIEGIPEDVVQIATTLRGGHALLQSGRVASWGKGKRAVTYKVVIREDIAVLPQPIVD